MVTEVITGSLDTSAEEMARLMLRYDIDHIPIATKSIHFRLFMSCSCRGLLQYCLPSTVLRAPDQRLRSD